MAAKKKASKKPTLASMEKDLQSLIDSHNSLYDVVYNSHGAGLSGHAARIGELESDVRHLANDTTYEYNADEEARIHTIEHNLGHKICQTLVTIDNEMVIPNGVYFSSSSILIVELNTAMKVRVVVSV